MLCIEFSEILDIHRSQIDRVREEGDSLTDPETPQACEAFSRQVRALESCVDSVYRIAVGMARKAPNLEEAAEVWKGVCRFCQAALQVLAGLKDKFPDCGTPELYDLVLDCKLAADKRHQRIAEEMACQTTLFPAGLLPEPN
jgi:hypothetical protein